MDLDTALNFIQESFDSYADRYIEREGLTWKEALTTLSGLNS